MPQTCCSPRDIRETAEAIWWMTRPDPITPERIAIFGWWQGFCYPLWRHSRRFLCQCDPSRFIQLSWVALGIFAAFRLALKLFRS
jgi:hypothetical protein